MGTMQTQFEDYEDLTGLKYSFNVFPRNKEQEKKCTIPISCLYQPLKEKENPILIESYPIACFNCKSILNPFCILDSNYKSWSCSICSYRNQLPNVLNQLPIELDPSSLDVEYIIPPLQNNNQLSQLKPMIFTYVVDLAIEIDELDALRDSLINSIDYLPPNSMIMLITFGKHVNVYELGLNDHQSCYTFNGFKEYTKDEISKKLGINSNLNKGNITNRFVQQTNICEFTLTNIFESLKKDSFKILPYHRNERSTGCAINVAFNMLSILYPKIGSRIMLFTGGPCTIGPGQIVETSFKNPLRSHHDLLKDSKVIKRFKNSNKFYEDIAEKVSINGHTVDIFIGCYDQIGLSEMECLVSKTGGVVVQSDSFTSAIFKQSFIKFLSVNEYGESQFGLNSTLEIKCKNVKVKGFIGHGSPLYLNNKDNNNKDKIKFSTEKTSKGNIGINGTNIFKLGSISNHSTYSIYFTLDENVIGDSSIIQFITSYQHPDGLQHIHVTTSQRMINLSNDSMDSVIDNFDQEGATVLIAKEAVYKVLNQSNAESLKFINKILIDFMSIFCKFRINDASSIIIPTNINLLPQFLYHLRRSNFIQIFNSSPDETSFYRHCFFMEDCFNSLTMIQPTLTSYELDKEPEPVLLDSTSIKPNRILFLDTFFHILIFHGSIIADWRRQKYQELPEYEYFKEFLELPRKEAADILVDRFPLPRFIDTEDGGSQARFLMSKLNPTTSYSNNQIQQLNDITNYQTNPNDATSGAVILTDDISLQMFMKFVYEAIVKTT